MNDNQNKAPDISNQQSQPIKRLSSTKFEPWEVECLSWTPPELTKFPKIDE